MTSNQQVVSPSEFDDSIINAENKKIQVNVQMKYNQILEERRWITNLIWNKVNSLIIVNGILFSAFNLLVLQGSKSDFMTQKTALSIVGFLVTIFWFFTLNHSINYKENCRVQIFQIQKDNPDLSINFTDSHHTSIGIFDTNTAVRGATIGLLILWSILVSGVKIGLF